MAFFRALLPIGNILIVASVVWLVFAILGVQLWKGTWWSCSDPARITRAACNGTFIDPASGALVPRHWIGAPINFDNVGEVRHRLHTNEPTNARTRTHAHTRTHTHTHTHIDTQHTALRVAQQSHIRANA